MTAALALLFGLSPVAAGERPPAGALPLSEIVKSLEAKGFSPITEISMDDGLWEVEAFNEDGRERELRVNPFNGDVISDRPDD